jgi:hypothetical protein
MIKNRKIVSLVLLLLSFTVIIANCDISSFSDSSKIKTCNTCPDISDHFEYIHTHGTEDFLTLKKSKEKAVHFLLKADFISASVASYSNKFISTIWQPPKTS